MAEVPPVVLLSCNDLEDRPFEGYKENNGVCHDLAVLPSQYLFLLFFFSFLLVSRRSDLWENYMKRNIWDFVNKSKHQDVYK